MAVTVLAIGANADADALGAVGLATAIAAPFFVVAGGNLRMLSIAGGTDALALALRLRLRLAALFAMLLVGSLWLIRQDLAGVPFLLACATIAWRGGDLCWDERALSMEVALGPNRVLPQVVGRNVALTAAIIAIALAPVRVGSVLLWLCLGYVLGGVVWLARGVGSQRQSPLVLGDTGLRRALFLSLGSVAVASGVLLLRHRLGASAGPGEVGRYFAIVGPLGMLGPAATGVGLYRRRAVGTRSSALGPVAGGIVLGTGVAIACQMFDTIRPPGFLFGSAIGEMWTSIPAVSGWIGLLVGSTVVAAMQEPAVVRARREGTSARIELALIAGLASVVLLGGLSMTWHVVLAATAVWTAIRALARTMLAA
jgi:Flp pilus assembly pilin Flp